MSLTRAEFSRLVADHSEALYRVAFRMMGHAHEAEDVVQETFRSAWTSRERFASQSHESPESGASDAEWSTPNFDRSERAWLVAILRRRITDRWRRRQHEVTITDAPDQGVESPDPFDSGYTDEMQQALSRLPAELRESLLLVVVGELTHQEAADLLKVPIGTVLSRVSRARSRLREQLKGQVSK
ncbi:MAG: RNA polymerase sigma factor [Planctomycetaceae bacterium]|nr:RNA polymerase sigma factor [Planctomycetaceae bacterium]